MATDLFGVDTKASRGLSGHERVIDGGDEWLTPPNVIAALGHFDLDPCAPRTPPFRNAAKHYSIEDDGLRQDWRGRVWLNPPYASAGVWMSRMASHGNGVALLFARTDTRTWQDHIFPAASGFRFLRGRLTFHLSNGRPAKAPAGAPSVLIAYGERDAEILRTCSLPGHYLPNERD